MSVSADAPKQSCQSAKTTFVEGSYAPDCSASAHAHRRVGIYFILQGSHTVTCRKTTHLVEPGTLIYLPAEESHRCCFPTQAKTFEISLQPSWLESLRPNLTIINCPLYYSSGDLTRLAGRAYKEFCNKDAFSSLALEGLVLEMLAGVARHHAQESNNGPRRPPRWLQDVYGLLQERFTEPPALDEIAQAVRVHPAHLGRMFRRYSGCTIGDYLRNLRLQQATHLLITSDTPLAEIALSCGYSDQSHFTSSFKRHTGSTPTEYRKLFYKRMF